VDVSPSALFAIPGWIVRMGAMKSTVLQFADLINSVVGTAFAYPMLVVVTAGPIVRMVQMSRIAPLHHHK